MQSVRMRSSGCRGLSVQGRGSVYLFMVLQPLDRSLGASPLRICHFCIVILMLLFFPFPPQYVVQNVSGFPSQPETKPLTSVGHFILVCNIVYVPIVALYHVYRRKKCIGYVISRYLKAWWWSWCIALYFQNVKTFTSRGEKSQTRCEFFLNCFSSCHFL